METYLGEIKVFAFDKIPTGWAPCNGQILAIDDHQKLYSLIGDAYGGNGSTTFALPNLNGCVGIGVDALEQRGVGAQGGSETVTLTMSEMPAHSHLVNASDENGKDYLNQNNDYLATFYNSNIEHQVAAYYALSVDDLIALNPKTVGFAGGGQPHENLMPYLVMSYCISIDGLYPTRS